MYRKGQFCIVPSQQGNFPKTVKTFIEIPPYAVDKESGEILNKTSRKILKRGDDFNFYEKIQSYKDDVDIYSILSKYSMSGDESLINQRVGTFSDVYDIPDNINDFTKANELKSKKLSQFSVEQQKAILAGSSDEVNNLVQELVKKELISKGVIKEESEVKKDE